LFESVIATPSAISAQAALCARRQAEQRRTHGRRDDLVLALETVGERRHSKGPRG